MVLYVWVPRDQKKAYPGARVTEVVRPGCGAENGTLEEQEAFNHCHLSSLVLTAS